MSEGPNAATQRPLRVLYVEDNPVNALLFGEAMKLHGAVELQVAADGAAALALVAGWLPDLLVLDAHLPDTDGRALLARLRRERPALAATPAVMCSADTEEEQREGLRDAGFAGYWAKPIDLAVVLADLDRLAAQRDAG
jgi:CheY-like chemotaxis protein